jgi:hypothetical protein
MPSSIHLLEPYACSRELPKVAAPMQLRFGCKTCLPAAARLKLSSLAATALWLRILSGVSLSTLS